MCQLSDHIPEILLRKSCDKCSLRSVRRIERCAKRIKFIAIENRSLYISVKLIRLPDNV